MTFSISEAVLEVLARYRVSALWVAYSGGVDSSVLLHILSQASIEVPVKALHINHGLSPNANAWQLHCEQNAARLGVPCVVQAVSVKSNAAGVESAARDARYEVFDQWVGQSHTLVMGHHREDQAETFFLRLLRGAGLRGLGAMPQSRPLQKGNILRPMLGISRKQIEQYASEHKLNYIVDESNANTAFSRNFLRKEIFLRLDDRWPDFSANVTRAVDHLQSANRLLDEYALEDFNRCNPRKDRFGDSLEFTPLLQMSSARRNNLLRYWLKQGEHLAPSAAHMDEIHKLIHAQKDANPQVDISEYQIRRYKTRIYWVARGDRSAHKIQTSLRWDSQQLLVLPDGSTLAFNSFSQDGIFPNFTVSFGNAPKRCKPLGRRHSQKIKKLFQEFEIPPWSRGPAPLIYLNDALVAVADFWVCELPGEAALDDAYKKWQFTWTPKPLNGAETTC